jgi:hypothetical protein
MRETGVEQLSLADGNTIRLQLAVTRAPGPATDEQRAAARRRAEDDDEDLLHASVARPGIRR